MSSTSSIDLINGGLDVQGIVDNLITVERDPITKLQAQTRTYQDKISAYQAFNSKLLAFKTSVESILFNGADVPLNIPSDFTDRIGTSLFALRKASSSNEAVVTASSDKGQVTGKFTVTVDNLATYDSYASGGFDSDTATATKTGTLVIQKGTATPLTVTVDSSNNTLQGIKNAINSANAGFAASIVNVGGIHPYRLAITSNDTGADNSLTITDNLDQGDGQAMSFSQTTDGIDAQLHINGISYSSASNSVTSAVDGVTFDLNGALGTAVIGVDHDLDAIVAGLKDFVAKYNDVVSYVRSQSNYDSTKKTAGLLSGDFTLRETQARLSSAISQSIDSDGSSFTLLSQIGIKLGNDGTLSLDETKLRAGLSANFTDTAHLLLADASDGEGGTVSLIPTLQEQLKNLTDSFDGPIHHATDALQQNIARINDQISQMEARLVVRRELLIAQYTKADQALRQLSVLQTSLTNQLSLLSGLT